MGRIALRSLFTVSCLVLAMPQGWCNFVPGLCGTAKGQSAAKTHGGCCDLCQCKDRQKAPDQPDKPPLPKRCCCYELDWLKPNPPVTITDGIPPIGFVALIISNPDGTNVFEPRLALHGRSPPIYLVNCVWRC